MSACAVIPGQALFLQLRALVFPPDSLLQPFLWCVAVGNERGKKQSGGNSG